jgi:PadR family transcriptional regulator PadR
MSFQVGASLLDALVLSIVEREETYGYKITQELRQAVELSESTLYPVLRRLQREGLLVAEDRPFNGRNRRYYRITHKGLEQLAAYRADWQVHRKKIDTLLEEGKIT